VVVLSKEHFLSLDQLTAGVLMDGFLLAQEATGRVERKDPTFCYTSINWNYLPQSGGGLFHPHLQVVIEDVATASHGKVLKGLKEYEERYDRSFWEDWLAQEMKADERYAGNQGDIHFLMAFSPGGILGEILILFPHCFVLKEVTSDDWKAFSEGLVKVFRFFKSKHIDSFNLSIFSGSGEGVRSRVYARLVPRILIPPWNTSDINYFEKLHEEVICVVSPEELCGELKPFFSPVRPCETLPFKVE
jgi:galactose-1-phosphate uridylyltransferase